MAIKPGYKTFTFDGQNSGSYGIYISGEAVYNAPEREVEMITIPGRNGAYAMDKGRFANIEVKYPAGTFDEDQASFADKISAFRNMMLSRKGYCRLVDEYNPEEYRMAVYKSGLDVAPVPFQRAGEFDLVFDCKPQRFLTSGETAVAVANNGTITNPTLFDAAPLLEIKGTGDIGINGETITVSNDEYGTVVICSTRNATQTLDTRLLNSGDVIIFSGDNLRQVELETKFDYELNTFNVASTLNCSASVEFMSSMGGLAKMTVTNPTFNFGTAASYTATATYNIKVTNLNTSTSYTRTATITWVIAYDGNDTITHTRTVSNFSGTGTRAGLTTGHISTVSAISTKPATGNPLYIDLDLGEAWNVDLGYPVFVNNAVTIPAELPKLAPGSNTITYDNTITSFKITPRWWKV